MYTITEEIGTPKSYVAVQLFVVDFCENDFYGTYGAH